MMTDITITSQCSGTPIMYCHINTDSPNDAPNESATVPTMTNAATRLLVTIGMMTKKMHSEEMPAIKKS